MNHLDIIIIIPLLWGLFKGVKNGFIIEIAMLVSLALGTWGALHFSGFVTEWLTTEMKWQFSYLYVVAFSITFLAIVIAIYFGAKLLEGVVKISAMGIFNRIAGAIFGTAKYFLLMSVILIIINKADKRHHFLNKGSKHDSFFYPSLTYVSDNLYNTYLEKF